MNLLIEALLKAKKEFMPVKRGETANIPTKSGANFSYKYADLETCIEATNPALMANGLLVVQTFAIVEGKSALVTTLYHVSGEMVQGVQLLDSKDNLDPQKMGASSTYARRYGYMAILGIAPEDDDAHIATKPQVKKVEESKAPVHNTTGTPVEKPSKRDFAGEIVSQSFNAVKARSEYLVRLAEDEQITICISKPLVEMMEGSKVMVKGFSTKEYNGKFFAEGISVVENDMDIPF